MTAMEDKLKQAGADTLGAEFYARATEALRANKSVRDAWRALGESWGHVTLTRIYSDMKGKMESEDHRPVETQSPNVFREGAGGGQSTLDVQPRNAAARSTPKQPKPFFQQKGVSDAQKQITRQAMLSGSSLWKELGMDRLRYDELDAFIREQIIAGAGHVKRAHYQAKRAAIAWLVKQHGVPPDPRALAKDCVTEKVAARYAAMSEQQANLIVAKLVQQTAAEIESGVKLIAAE